jgi:cellulose synthase/poly-beta-1,6-N-acetylglucosamine synthase-like glycosyltransferase
VASEIAFWSLAAVVVYVYLGFPVLVWLLARLFGRLPERKPITPSVSLLVAAYNEAAVIEAKVRNSLAVDYPPDRLEIVIASDGSTDATAEIAARLADGKRVRVVAYPRNRGKLAVLNETVPTLSGEIIAFSDASSMIAPESIRRLVANFADPAVGAVSGLYRVAKQDEAAIGPAEDRYWRYETFLKRQEGLLGSILGAHGALYAIRRPLYPFPPATTINDDYVIPVRILQQGYRVVYEPQAVAIEEAREMSGFSRRARIMAGNFEQLRELRALLSPPRWLPLLFFISHKAGRLVVPACLLALLVSNALLPSTALYVALWRLQLAFYALAALGTLYPLKPGVLRLPYYFCMINAATFVGAYHVLSGRRKIAWKH